MYPDKTRNQNHEEKILIALKECHKDLKHRLRAAK